MQSKKTRNVILGQASASERRPGIQERLAEGAKICGAFGDSYVGFPACSASPRCAENDVSLVESF